jgi:hypothetical protein
MAKVITCPQCETELTEATSRFKIVNGGKFKMKCGICFTGWTADVQDFRDKVEEEKCVAQSDS